MTPWPSSDMEIVIFVAIITNIQALFNHLGIKVTTFLTDISGYIIFATTAVLSSPAWSTPRQSTSRGSGTIHQLFRRGGRQRVPAVGQHGLPLPAVPAAAGLHDHRYDPRRTRRKRPRARAIASKGIVSRRSLVVADRWIMICAIILAHPDMNHGGVAGLSACSSHDERDPARVAEGSALCRHPDRAAACVAWRR